MCSVCTISGSALSSAQLKDATIKPSAPSPPSSSTSTPVIVPLLIAFTLIGAALGFVLYCRSRNDQAEQQSLEDPEQPTHTDRTGHTASVGVEVADLKKVKLLTGRRRKPGVDDEASELLITGAADEDAADEDAADATTADQPIDADGDEVDDEEDEETDEEHVAVEGGAHIIVGAHSIIDSIIETTEETTAEEATRAATQEELDANLRAPESVAAAAQ